MQIQPRFNDWFVNRDTDDLGVALAPFVAGFDHVAGIGFSMGGYGALRLSAALNMAQVVAISPQVSIAPRMVPFDRRYREEGRGFDPVLGDLATHARRDLQGVVIFDPFRPLDRRHADMIGAILPGMALCRYGFGGHPATDILRKTVKFAAIQQLVITRSLTPAAVLALHRANRAVAPAWWRGVAARAENTGHFALAIRPAPASALDAAADFPLNAPNRIRTSPQVCGPVLAALKKKDHDNVARLRTYGQGPDVWQHCQPCQQQDPSSFSAEPERGHADVGRPGPVVQAADFGCGAALG